MSHPATVASPPSGGRIPQSIRSVVVFPEASGPTRPKISPVLTSKFRSLTAVNDSKDLVRWVVWMDSIGVSSKLQAPASAEAASRRQAKYQINSSAKNSKFQTPSLFPSSLRGEGGVRGLFETRRRMRETQQMAIFQQLLRLSLRKRR